MFGVKYKSDSGSRSSRCCVMAFQAIVLVYCMCGVVNSMQIKHFFVPDTANLKSSDWIKLECNLEVNDTERRQVVIQWFLNDNTLLYQWSENRSTRQPYINLNFVDPVSLSLTKINGSVIEAPIKISHKTIHHSGLYKCNAFSFINETADEDEMQMYVPVDNITLEHVYDNNTNELNITCGTEDVYPKPEIRLLINGQENLTNEPILDVRIKENQLFDITAYYVIPINDLKSINRINCSVILPGIKYTNSRLTQYNKSGYDGVDIDTDSNATTISAQDSKAPGGSTLNLINSYLIPMSMIAVFMLAREIV